jgi:hypothetical protein
VQVTLAAPVLLAGEEGVAGMTSEYLANFCRMPTLFNSRGFRHDP